MTHKVDEGLPSRSRAADGITAFIGQVLEACRQWLGMCVAAVVVDVHREGNGRWGERRVDRRSTCGQQYEQRQTRHSDLVPTGLTRSKG